MSDTFTERGSFHPVAHKIGFCPRENVNYMSNRRLNSSG